LDDDPVPKTVARALHKLDLRPLADALLAMPVHASKDQRRMKERLGAVQEEVRKLEVALWSELLKHARLRSPLLVLDEAHHLKNEGTRLARQFRLFEGDEDLRVGDGALARCFDRMLFLTATPFQLGHHELVSVLRRFRDVRWNEQELGEQESFIGKMKELHERLDDSQRSAIQFQRQWAKLPPDVVEGDPEAWWSSLASSDREQLERRYRDLLNAFDKARTARTQAQDQLRPWVHGTTRAMFGQKYRSSEGPVRKVRPSMTERALVACLFQLMPCCRSSSRPGVPPTGARMCWVKR
ncbi:MAG TPA: hypothetical protein PLA11_17535, partial [Flavobacteriales bacterium]|nr:hypothetical protein [Flavobacteriales bacterium]